MAHEGKLLYFLATHSSCGGPLFSQEGLKEFLEGPS